MSKESIIKMLKASIKSDKKYNDSGGHVASWRDELGVLITRNDAEEIVSLLSNPPQDGTKNDGE